MQTTIPILVGFDTREPMAHHVFCHSVLERTKARVAFYPIRGEQRDGSNVFIYERFKAAEYLGYRGRAIYADGDMLCRADVAELIELAAPGCAVTVAQHDYKTKFPVKYLGNRNEDYPRKNWSSLMVLDCNAEEWKRIDVDRMTGKALHRFEFIEDHRIGALPLEWNWLVGEYPHNPAAKLVHFTVGGPYFPEYATCDYADEWFDTWRRLKGPAL